MSNIDKFMLNAPQKKKEKKIFRHIDYDNIFLFCFLSLSKNIFIYFLIKKNNGIKW